MNKDKDEVYLVCREMNGALKASLHHSGNWHLAYTQTFFEKSFPEEHQTERGIFIDKWKRPEPIAPGVTLAYRIVTSWAAVTARDKKDSSIFSVQAPTQGKAIEFGIFLLNSNIPPTMWPPVNVQPVGSYTLPSGNQVCVVWREIDMPGLGSLHGNPKFFRGKSKRDLRGGRLKVLLFQDQSDGSKTIYDCAAEHLSFWARIGWRFETMLHRLRRGNRWTTTPTNG
jgi:hypothetical protein